MSSTEKRNEIFVKIGERIRYYRIKSGLTQEKVSEMVGITQKHLSRIESGYHDSHFVTIMEIAKALKVPIDVFTEDLDENSNTELINIIISEMKDMNRSQLQMLRDNIDIIKKYQFS